MIKPSCNIIVMHFTAFQSQFIIIYSGLYRDPLYQ